MTRAHLELADVYRALDSGFPEPNTHLLIAGSVEGWFDTSSSVAPPRWVDMWNPALDERFLDHI